MRISDWSSDVCSSDLINLSVVIADQPRSLRHQQDSAGRAIIGILGDLRGDLAGKVGSQAGDQRGRYDAPGLQHIGRSRRRQPLGAGRVPIDVAVEEGRSEEHTSELQSLMRISYAVFCLKKKQTNY